MSKLPVNSQFGSFHIMRHIGGGGMAQIYLAKSRGLAGFEKVLALKVINPEYADEDRFVQMLIDEAKISVGLSHVNIGQIFDLGQVNGIYYIAMEFVDGIDVLELVNGLYTLGEKVPVVAVAFIGKQMCSGLNYAHTRRDIQGHPLNIIHRDISPQNILVSRAGEVKVVDFGIAKAAGMSSKTHAGVIKGKVHYMAPEQALGQKIDHRIDIFSAGIVLWEMLTSQMVYSGDNVRELLEKVRRANLSPPSKFRPEVPPALDAIVMKALSRKVDDRFQTAYELQVELTKFLSASAVDYSGSHLAMLVEKVLSRKTDSPAKIESHFSKEEFLPDVHSVISDNIDDITDLRQEARLVVQIGEDRSIHPIGKELILGRAGTLPIPDARVSRRHARIFLMNNQYLVEDLGSSNGTYVNDLRLDDPRPLQGGDMIRVGSCHMQFFFGHRERLAESAPAQAILPRPARPRLIISCGKQRMEKTLEEQVPMDLEYFMNIGPHQLKGISGCVIKKEDGFWIEPRDSRLALTVNDHVLSEPLRLSPGAHFDVGHFHFQYLEETAEP